MMFCSLLCILSAMKNWWGLICLISLVSCRWMTEMSFDLGMIHFVLVDKMSFFLIFLTLWVSLLMINGSYYVKFGSNKESLFLFLVLFMNLLLVLSFSSSDLLMFYILFEATLIPIFMLVFGWGYQPERVKASYYLLFYTLFASLPLLIALLFFQTEFGSLDLNLLPLVVTSGSVFLFLAVVVAFLVKLPVYFGHLWLPKAHVEAPMAGSMVLAGILLKLGGYGLIRMIPLVMESSWSASSWLINLGLFGAISASFICIRQTDLKSLIAYSSVAHMGLVIVGLFLLNWTAWFGCIIIMVAHGLCSSGLFYLVGVLYYRLGSRSMLLIRGCISSMPLMTLWWFLFAAANMAAPPTPNLAGEILIFMSSLGSGMLVALIVGLASFMGAAYNLFLFSATQHGNRLIEINSGAETSFREHSTLAFHFIPLIFSLWGLLGAY
uniref:NADH-ubiquinone oxidoreductase chain 4 n=1 Tax=Diaphanosoma excisum TaxID=2094052 RepID=A0A8A1RXT4_9CRUS|nr:NADH dehydrogenase subunit 4 [Diaphanosoma excisum]QST19912.1 NADH dehydrogenase subunit 4 [Diaphanosoma excisum]